MEEIFVSVYFNILLLKEQLGVVSTMCMRHSKVCIEVQYACAPHSTAQFRSFTTCAPTHNLLLIKYADEFLGGRNINDIAVSNGPLFFQLHSIERVQRSSLRLNPNSDRLRCNRRRRKVSSGTLFPPVPGTLLLFPGWLSHCVLPSASRCPSPIQKSVIDGDACGRAECIMQGEPPSPRISLSFNFR